MVQPRHYVGAEPALSQGSFPLVDDLDEWVSAGGQRYFELGIPLWSLSAPR